MYTFEPGGTVLGSEIRHLLLHSDTDMCPLAEMMLFCADRAEHLQTVVVPRLLAGTWVVSDRFSPATYAYQVNGSSLDFAVQAFLDADHAARCALWQGTGQWHPDLTLILDLPPGEGMRRKGNRLDKIERRGEEYHQRVAEGFRFYGRGEMSCPATVISAAGTVEEVQARVIEQVVKQLPPEARGDESGG
jgi:dTMP kinase